MKNVLLLVVLVVAPIFAQEEMWVRRYNPANNYDYAYAIAVDGEGNVYVTGFSYGGTLDYATIKYNSAGDELWVSRYNGTGDDKSYAIAVDGEGNVYVTGFSYDAGTSDYVTIKYNSAGDELWVRRYDGPGNSNDLAWAIAVDCNGNVYVTGRSVGNGYDYATIKYNSEGDELWVSRYNGWGYNDDFARAIAVDCDGNVYVTGGSASLYTSDDYATIKYNSEGDTLWIRRYDGPASYSDVATSIAVDDDGNVYVAGWSQEFSDDYATIKYNSAGDELWVSRYNGPAGVGDDILNAMVVDDDGNVHVAGWSQGVGTSGDYATIKYNSEGDELWASRYDGPDGDNGDYARAMAVDGEGNVYVTGWSEDSSGIDYAYDCVTIRYNSIGDEVWDRRYNGPGNGKDYGNAIAVDSDGYIYVTGGTCGLDSTLDFVTIKYCPTSEVKDSTNFTYIKNNRLEVYPNLFTHHAVIGYSLTNYTDVGLMLYDITGRLVKILVQGKHSPGSYKLCLDASELVAGIYFAKLTVGNYTETKKFIVLKH